MIIAYYPGTGGNRFYLWLNDKKNFAPKQGYDDANFALGIDANRYPGRNQNQINAHVIFTHCLNFDLVTQTWPDHKDIYFLNFDRSLGLRRHWFLFQNKHSTDPNPASGAFSVITWHDEYYQQYPYQLGRAIEVNENTFPEFFNMMNTELQSIICPEFDFAQAMFDQHGAQAPIEDLYKEQFIQ